MQTNNYRQIKKRKFKKRYSALKISMSAILDKHLHMNQISALYNPEEIDMPLNK